MTDLDLNPVEQWRQQYRDELDGKTREQVMPYSGDDVTAAELDAVRDYQTDITGICFDSLDGIDVLDGIDRLDVDDQLHYLVAISGLLGEWWDAVDTLDSKIRNPTTGSESAHNYLQWQIRNWFHARHRFLLALAHATGVKVPQPDDDAGAVFTSGRCALGVYGYHQLTDWL